MIFVRFEDGVNEPAIAAYSTPIQLVHSILGEWPRRGDKHMDGTPRYTDEAQFEEDSRLWDFEREKILAIFDEGSDSYHKCYQGNGGKYTWIDPEPETQEMQFAAQERRQQEIDPS